MKVVFRGAKDTIRPPVRRRFCGKAPNVGIAGIPAGGCGAFSRRAIFGPWWSSPGRVTTRPLRPQTIHDGESVAAKSGGEVGFAYRHDAGKETETEV